MRSTTDFAPYRRSSVGFDRLFDMLENSSFGAGQENYPPFDLIKDGDNEYRIELAVAGFKSSEIDITAQQNVLIVTGRKGEDHEQSGGNAGERPQHDRIGGDQPAGRQTVDAEAEHA